MWCSYCMARRGGGSRIRTCVALRASDLQSDGFSRSPIPPRRLCADPMNVSYHPWGPLPPRGPLPGETWSPRRESNPQPADYKSAALPLRHSGRDGIRLNQKRRPAGPSNRRLSYTCAGESSVTPAPSPAVAAPSRRSRALARNLAALGRCGGAIIQSEAQRNRGISRGGSMIPPLSVIPAKAGTQGDREVTRAGRWERAA